MATDVKALLRPDETMLDVYFRTRARRLLCGVPTLDHEVCTADGLRGSSPLLAVGPLTLPAARWTRDSALYLAPSWSSTACRGRGRAGCAARHDNTAASLPRLNPRRPAPTSQTLLRMAIDFALPPSLGGPGGQVHILDLGRPRRAAFAAVRASFRPPPPVHAPDGRVAVAALDEIGRRRVHAAAPGHADGADAGPWASTPPVLHHRA